MTSTPLMIVMTPVRNEAWVLPAFLESTSRWADYIIIADQMSTIGVRFRDLDTGQFFRGDSYQ